MIGSPPQHHHTPRVAVIVPAYGVAHLVGEALASLQRQTLAAWECVVVDDGAPDNVANAVQPFLADPRIRLLCTDNQGVSTARNRAIHATQAPIIALLDGDDLLRPAYLETTTALLNADSSLRFVTCNASLFGAVTRERRAIEQHQGKTDGLHGTLADVLDRSFSVYIGTTFRRADFDRIGGFDPTMAQSEDFDLWVRLMMLGGRARYVDQILGDYRVRPASASANSARMLIGNLRVYGKAAAALPQNAPEQPLLTHLLTQTRAALAFEHAIDRIITGHTHHGLAELRLHRDHVSGPVWATCFILWHIAPWLARPMLHWRRYTHSRGAMPPLLFRALRNHGP